uniref:Putative secreted protein n=1 Tax=Ixodes ricinus TaxID=34613 RepID=A0A6B0UU34_IXORI
MSKALALLTFRRVTMSAHPPWLLVEHGAAPLTACPTCVVFALAVKLPVGLRRTLLGVSRAHALSTNRDVFDGVVVPACNRLVHLVCLADLEAHEVRVQRPDALEPQSYVARLREIHQLFAELFGTGPPIHERRVDLSVFKRCET